MPEILDKSYNPQLYENEIYKKWEESGYFNPDNLNLPEDAPTYTIILPPPNITDKLHLGHASTVAIEDLLIRYHRLKGYRALWLPGTDHAAIATQNVVEKKIKKEENLSRHDLGREKFLEKVWSFLQETQSTILYQIRRLGGSLDWSRQAFTLDEPRQAAVAKMFCDMYEGGAIYRGERIVNWCPRCHSTLADDEVEYKAQTAKIYTFKYSSDFPIAISTTRPETKLGDTAIAVNPKDERYKQYIGQEYDINFVGQPLHIKIIADHNVEMEFGTGALGVTPAHSAVDWQMAEKNNLEIKKIINEDGLIYNVSPEYNGLTGLEAREKVVAKLRETGLLISEEDMENNLSVCYRCDTPIEPLPSKQWFVAVDKKLERLDNKSLKEKALEAAENGSVKFVPERFYKKYTDWVNNLHDWCISRQIWFGHRIPVWYKGEEIYVGTTAPTESGWTQDPDTLDTWFSSSMWTFSTLGWPENYVNGQKTGDLAKFHPTQVLETGYEIITLWVSRMIMMSLFALQEIPFQTVYLHGMILDKDGKKMSKSKGNGIDPVTVSDEFGTDAVRLSLLYGTTPGNDARLSEEKITAQRNFINKLWNISRYILSDVEQKYFAADDIPAAKTLADKWILSRFNQTMKAVGQKLDNYEFSLAVEELNYFTWNELADWYLEIAKIEKDKEAILAYILKNLLRAYHPFIPFVTEVIWGKLAQKDLLLVSSWPQTTELEDNAEFKLITDLVASIRNARSENKIEPAQKIKALIYAPTNQELISSQAEIIKGLKTGISELTIAAQGEKIADAIFIALGDMEIYLVAEIDPAKEAQRIAKEKENLNKMIASLESKLNNAEFVAKAPEKIVAVEKAKLENYRQELDKLNNR
ncbi:MAG TPA: valine--tRNA ligase [bacterium]|nr:valine--tRNA ligase [bacterium]HPT29538.1 valine--tRNA ligase [bacterium]